MPIPCYERQLHVQSVGSTVHLGRLFCKALVFLVCSASLSVAASATSRGSTTDASGRILHSHSNPNPGLPEDPMAVITEERTTNPSRQPTFTQLPTASRRRHRHNRGRRRKQRNDAMGDTSSNAADINSGATIKIGSTSSGFDNSGVIASTPWKASPRKSSLSDSGETEIISLCPNCGLREGNTHTNQPLNREEMVNIRIEAVKQQILDKLRLTRPPQVNVSKLHIPAPLSEGRIPDLAEHHTDEFSHHGDTIHGEHGRESYYGTTTKIIIQAEQDDVSCRPDAAGGKCFTFRFSSSNTKDNIHTAQLWVYWNGSVFADHPTPPDPDLSVTVQEISAKTQDPPRVVTTDDFTGLSMVGWMKFDVKPSVRRWHRHTLVDHSIRVKCNNYHGLQASDIVEALSPSLKSGFTPFIVIHTTKSKRGSRVKRSSSDCTIVGDSNCCRESLYIQFSDIGWDWILMPTGFQANFCRGVCHLSTHLQSHHSGFAAIYEQRNRAMRNRGIAFETCCSPTMMSDLSILFVDDNDQFNRVDIPEMTIESCGCSF
nr:activin [Holothuria scabra]